MIKAQPYKVVIEKDGISKEIPVHNANGIYKSVELDEVLEQGKGTIKAYQEYTIHRDSFYNSIKDKPIEEVTEEESKKLEEITEKEQKFQKQMRIDTLRFIECSVKNASEHREIIDSLVGEEAQEFISCIKIAGLGGSSESTEENKKKIESITLEQKRDLKDGGKQKMK